jgi:hypothetical protein
MLPNRDNVKIPSSPAKSTNTTRRSPIRSLLVTIVAIVGFSVCVQIFGPMVAKKIAAEITSTPNLDSKPSAGLTTQQNKTDTSRLNVARAEKIQTAEQQAQACRSEADLQELPDYAAYFYSRPRYIGFPGKDYIFVSVGTESVRDDYIYLVMVPCMARLKWPGTKQQSTIENFLTRFELLKNRQLSQIGVQTSPIDTEKVQTKQLLRAVVPDLPPWPEYSSKAGATPAVYNDYVNNKFPDYLAQLGYTKEQIASEVEAFKKLVPSPLNAVSESSYFTNVQLTYGVSLDIPSHWTVLSQDSRKTIAAAGEAVLENAGIAGTGGKRKNLLAVSAVPSPTGATIRVNMSTPPEYMQADLAKLSPDDLKQLRTGFLAQFKQLEASGGPKILEMQIPRVDRISNNLALIMIYIREGANGSSPWEVTQYKVLRSDRLIEITLSHRAEDGIVWKPILEKVGNSVRLL